MSARATGSAGQVKNDGSTIAALVSRPVESSSTRWQAVPRQASTSARPWATGLAVPSSPSSAPPPSAARAPSSAAAAPVTSDDLVKAQDNAKEWLAYGRDYHNWRYSPLSEITPQNVAKLAPAWAMSTGGQFGGLEATPLFHDGVLYFSADYARVFAVDAKSGNILWRYEPKYDDGFSAILCCGPIHRGVALKDDLVIVARLDAKLVALNRAVALAEVHGPQAGIEAVGTIQNLQSLDAYYLLHAVLGEFESRLNHHQAAAAHFRKSLHLAEIKSEQHFLARRLKDCEAQASGA